MRHTFSSVVAAALLICAASIPARASTVGLTAVVISGGTTVDVPSGTATPSSPVQVGGASITWFDGLGDTDPLLNFDLTVTGGQSASPVDITLSIAVSPPFNSLVAIAASLEATVTAPPGGGGASFGSLSGNFMTQLIGVCDTGVDMGNILVNVPAGGSTDVTFTNSGTFLPSAGCNNSLGSHLTFTASAGASYHLIGNVTANVLTPEPATIGLVVTGLAAALRAARGRIAGRR